jgi:hypothetical protein
MSTSATPARVGTPGHIGAALDVLGGGQAGEHADYEPSARSLRVKRASRTSDHTANATIRAYRGTKVMSPSWKSQTFKSPSATTSCARGANA